MTVKPAHKRGTVVVELDRGEEKLLTSQPSPLFAVGTILVPTDFSECSREALRYAVPLAKQFGARIVLLHVADFQYAGSEIDDLDLVRVEQQVVATYRQRLEDIGKEEAGGVRFEIVASVSKVLSEIISTAKSTKADLIVISTHGWSGMGTPDPGSTTERVVRHAPCPVLVVPAKETI